MTPRSSPTWRVCVIGPCVVRADRGGAPAGEVFEPSLIQRRILARLAVAQGGAVAATALVDVVWGGSPPRTANAALQNQVARLRDRLGRDVIETTGDGYRLGVATDLDLVSALLQAADSARSDGRSTEAGTLAGQALDTWRGRPLTELEDWTPATSIRTWLAEAHRAFEDIRLMAAIDDGRLVWALPEAERLVADHLDDERRWALLVSALGRAGRRGDALAALDRARRHLADTLGLDLGDELRELHDRLLAPGVSSSRTAAIPLVGRAELVTEIVAATTSCPFIVVSGEPGIGRSRLLDAVARRLRRDGRSVSSGVCSRYPTSATATLAELADGLGMALHPADPPRVALRTVLRRAVARDGGVTLLVDDLHLAGPSTIDAVVTAAGEPGVNVIATADADHPALDDIDCLSLVVPLLSPDEVHDMVVEALGRPLSDADPPLEWFVTMTGGNPAMVECLVENPSGGSLPTGSLDPTARDLVRRRLSALSPRCRAALDVAAVLGSTCTLDLLEELAGRRATAEALASGMLVEVADAPAEAPVESPDDPTSESSGRVSSPRLEFRHGAVERIVLDDLPGGRRNDLHYHAALRLADRGGSAAAIATHAVAAGGIAPLQTAQAATDAAREASERGAHPEAAAWLEHAVTSARLAGPAGVRTSVAASIALADALRLCGSLDHGDRLLAAAHQAIELADLQLIGEATFAVLQLGQSSDSGDLHDRALALTARARGLVTDPHLVACIDGAASLAHSLTGDADLCRQLFLSADTTAVEDRTRRAVLPFAYLALGHPRDSDLRRTYARELVERGRAAEDPVALFEGLQLSFAVALQDADGDSLRCSLDETAEVIDRVGDVGRRWSFAYQQAALAHVDGRLDDADALSAEALAIFSPVSPDRAMAAWGGQLLGIQLARGTLADLTDTLRDMVAGSPGIPAWNAALALSLVDTDPSEAAHYARVALDNTVEDFVWLAGHLIGGRAAALVHDHLDPAVTLEYTARLEPYSGLCCWQGTCTYGPVDTTLALLAAARGDDAAARHHIDVAARLADSLRSPTFAADVDRIRASL